MMAHTGRMAEWLKSKGLGDPVEDEASPPFPPLTEKQRRWITRPAVGTPTENTP